MRVPEHLLLWVLDPCVLSLGPSLNPREDKKIPLVFGGSLARFSLSECQRGRCILLAFCSGVNKVYQNPALLYEGHKG